jgi:hypothetical protein
MGNRRFLIWAQTLAPRPGDGNPAIGSHRIHAAHRLHGDDAVAIDVASEPRTVGLD